MSDDTAGLAAQIRRQGDASRKTGRMRIVQYVVIALLGAAVAVTSIGWYLSAHPGGVRFAECHWQGDTLVLGYTYGSGDTVDTMVRPEGDHVVAQLRVDEAGGDHGTAALTATARYPVDGGPLPVRYPNGADLTCATR